MCIVASHGCRSALLPWRLSHRTSTSHSKTSRTTLRHLWARTNLAKTSSMEKFRLDQTGSHDNFICSVESRSRYIYTSSVTSILVVVPFAVFIVSHFQYTELMLQFDISFHWARGSDVQLNFYYFDHYHFSKDPGEWWKVLLICYILWLRKSIIEIEQSNHRLQTLRNGPSG